MFIATFQHHGYSVSQTFNGLFAVRRDGHEVGHVEVQPYTLTKSRVKVYPAGKTGEERIPPFTGADAHIMQELAKHILVELQPAASVPDFVLVPYSMGVDNAIGDYLRDELPKSLRRYRAGNIWQILIYPSETEIGRIRFAPHAEGMHELRPFARGIDDQAFSQVWAGLLAQLTEQGWLDSQRAGGGGAETTQPEKRGSVAQMTVNNLNFGIQILSGRDVKTEDIVNRDKTTNNTEVNIADKPTTG